ncbi:hypothetical protein [Paeniglutamicibacter psychrophenolicus]|uniref:hypothetical protein n=1 Tax=Paeniglutamicibacter psychrophenolicus TaxID=257454 RepID=UPI002780670B|nr:hypothetical protein [Paeniglutamicibacter psychrophenolicus]MDQ0092447.1 hypothetical protein [Paeniglutamicibacter psychrophenolicus]
MRDRVIWLVVGVVLAAMAASLWTDAWVAALGAGSAAAYCLLAAIRGRCFGDACALSTIDVLPVEKVQETARE